MGEARIKYITMGTRGSDLALFQANHVSWILQKQNVELSVKIKTIATSGDKILDSPLSKIGDKGLFVKEIESELLSEDIDVAVHSCKDMPTELPVGLMLAACGQREDPRDVFIGNAGSLDDIPRGARIGTSSLRRRSQLLSLRPDLEVVDIRGNVDTRIRKIEEEEMFGTILAAAGVKRLGREDDIGFYFSEEEIIPAVGQGTIALECRENDISLRGILKGFDDTDTGAAVTAERALMHELEGGCQVPIAARAVIDNGDLAINAYLGSLDGSQVVRGSRSGPVEQAEEIGVELARELLADGGEAILAAVRASG